MQAQSGGALARMLLIGAELQHARKNPTGLRLDNRPGKIFAMQARTKATHEWRWHAVAPRTSQPTRRYPRHCIP